MIYNKLVRDKIPEIIKHSGKRPIFRLLNDEEMHKALKDKLIEETQELVNAETREQAIEEMADVLEVIDGMRYLYGIFDAEVTVRKIDKRAEKGAFIEGYYLEEVQE